MADIAVTKSTISAFNTLTTRTPNPATTDAANTAQDFTFSPSKMGSRVVIEVTVADTHGAVALSIAAGGFHQSIAALTLSVAQATTKMVVLETAKYMSAAGVITITATPASGKKLTSDHALSMAVVELPG
jgi:hypothetical protein